MSPTELTRALRWRYATKLFDPERGIPAEIWEALLDALVCAPSSFGLQPWRFIVVEDAAVRAQLRQASWNQPQITEADKLVVFTSRTDLTPDDTARWMECLATAQGQDPADLDGYAKVINGFSRSMSVPERHAWNNRQTYIALGQFMSSAALLEVDTCPLEGIDTAGYDAVLGLGDSGYATCVACAAGYRSTDDASAVRPKARFPREDLIEFR